MGSGGGGGGGSAGGGGGASRFGRSREVKPEEVKPINKDAVIASVSDDGTLSNQPANLGKGAKGVTGLNDEEKAVVSHWIGQSEYVQLLKGTKYESILETGWDYMNKSLWNDAWSPNAAQKLFAARLDQVLSRVKNKPGKSVRSVNLHRVSIDSFEPGKTVNIKAFSAATISHNKGAFPTVASHTPPAPAGNKEPVRLRIVGKTGKYIKPLSKYKNEGEVLYRPNTKFKVIDKKYYQNRWYIDIKEV